MQLIYVHVSLNNRTIPVGLCKQWKTVATKLGISVKESQRMASAFEHRDLEFALQLN